MTRARLALIAFAAWPCALAAQEGSVAPPGVVAPASDSVGPFDRPDGSRLRRGSSVYRLTLQRGGSNAPLGTRTVVIPMGNHDNNQHSFNENLRIQNLWDGIELMAALLAM